MTAYEVKKASLNADDQSEVRMGELVSKAGNRVHFTDGVGKADLRINGVLTDVKHLTRASSIKSAITRGRNQGQWVLLDGTTIQLTLQQATTGIAEFEAEAKRHPGPIAGITRILIVLGNSQLAVHNRIPTLAGISWAPGSAHPI
jgi:hypothetical protein